MGLRFLVAVFLIGLTIVLDVQTDATFWNGQTPAESAEDEGSSVAFLTMLADPSELACGEEATVILQATDGNGLAVEGATIKFVTGPGGTVSPSQVETDMNGVAETLFVSKATHPGPSEIVGIASPVLGLPPVVTQVTVTCTNPGGLVPNPGSLAESCAEPFTMDSCAALGCVAPYDMPACPDFSADPGPNAAAVTELVLQVFPVFLVCGEKAAVLVTVLDSDGASVNGVTVTLHDAPALGVFALNAVETFDGVATSFYLSNQIAPAIYEIHASVGSITETTTLTCVLPEPPEVDSDGDGWPDEVDNCPGVSNFDQADMDGDGIGDACDMDDGGGGVPEFTDRDRNGDGLPDVCEQFGHFNVINGNHRDNHIRGTAGNDLIRGGGGNDVIDGKGGDDCIVGGPGNDRVNGGRGSDIIFGGSGKDSLSGDRGDDRLGGEEGDDRVDGQDGNDELHGGTGGDQLYGGDGNDALFGHQGKDKLEGGAGDDSLDGGTSNDRLLGQAGKDVLVGGSGSDFLNGGSGKDQCNGEHEISCEL